MPDPAKADVTTWLVMLQLLAKYGPVIAELIAELLKKRDAQGFDPDPAAHPQCECTPEIAAKIKELVALL